MKFKKRIFYLLEIVAIIFLLIYSGILNKIKKEDIVYMPPDELENKLPQNLILKSSCDCRKIDEIIIQKTDLNISVSLRTKSNTEKKLLLKMSKQQFYNLRFTCDLFNVLRRGPSQKVLSYSLYGKQVRYYKILKDIARQAKQFYPDWIIRIYHDDSIDESIKCELECLKDADNSTLLTFVISKIFRSVS